MVVSPKNVVMSSRPAPKTLIMAWNASSGYRMSWLGGDGKGFGGFVGVRGQKIRRETLMSCHGNLSSVYKRADNILLVIHTCMQEPTSVLFIDDDGTHPAFKCV